MIDFKFNIRKCPAIFDVDLRRKIKRIERIIIVLYPRRRPYVSVCFPL